MGRGRRQTAAPAVATIAVTGTEHRVWQLRPGVLDDAAISCFTQGQCHALALALHERTGWPLVAVRDWMEEIDHLAVRTPDGRILDATGVHGEDDFQEAWDGEVGEISAEQVRQLSGGPWRAPDLEAARTFTGAVIAYQTGERASGHPGAVSADGHARPAQAARVQRADGGLVEVRAGVLDEATRALYRGAEQSAALAGAIWLAAGPEQVRLVLVADEEDEPVHAAVELTDGRLLDVDGVHEPDAFAARWPGRRRPVRRPSELEEEVEEAWQPWPSQDAAAAELVVGPLLAAARLRRRAGA